MAKAIRWTVPFQSIKGTNYKINIYDDYEGSVPASWPIVLEPGENPFETKDDNNDDVFAPIRHTTGSLEVIDRDGTLMEQMLPSTNVSRPVVVIKNTSSPKVMFNGFLNCEAYSQDYDGSTQSLSMSVNGVLATMENIEFDTSFIGHKKVREIIANIIAKVKSVAGINIYDYIYISATARKAMNKMIDTSSLFEENEQSNESTNTYEVCGASCKDILERICTFMGWTLREYANALYFQRVTDEYRMARVSVANLSVDSDAIFEQSLYMVDITEINMSALSYSGADHKKEVRQGAKSVEVKAGFDDYKTSCELPQDFPLGPVSTGSTKMVIDDDVYTIKVMRDAQINSKLHYRFFHCDEGQYEVAILREEGGVDDVFNSSYLNWSEYSFELHEYVGAMLVNLVQTFEDVDPKKETGIYVCAFTDDNSYLRLYNQDRTRYIMRLQSILPLCVSDGTITIDPKAYLCSHIGDTDKVEAFEMKNGDYIQLVIKWGNKYLKNASGTPDIYEWSNTYSVVTLTKSDNGISVPIEEYNAGVFEVYLHPYRAWMAASDERREGFFNEFLLQSLNIKYIPKSVIYNDRDSNIYFRIVNMQFNEKITIDTDIASNLGNKKTPSHLFDNNESMTTVIGYIHGVDEPQILVDMRPELDLLTRMAWHYAKSRRTINLEVRELSTALPLVWIRNDYEPTSRLYSPLAVERNYQEDTTTLTCMEIPDKDEWVF